MEKKAVILTIGDEILSGDVLDENSNWIAKRLFKLGVELAFIFVLPDNKEIITKYINEYRTKYDFLITIGGMGPTPDDVTKDAIADAFQVKLEKNKEVIQLIQNYYSGKASEEKLIMSIFPENSEPILTSDKTWAIGLKMENLFSFPGTPFLVRDAFPSIEPLLKSEPIFKTKISVNCEETIFADIMCDMLIKYPMVHIGSYPSGNDFRKVKLLFKSRQISEIEQCRDEFIRLLKERYNELEIS